MTNARNWCISLKNIELETEGIHTYGFISLLNFRKPGIVKQLDVLGLHGKGLVAEGLQW